VRVFAVWQPMLATDLAPPLTLVLRRLSDRRVQQYWDPEHLLAKRMGADARPPQPEHECCERSGILWDLAAVYAADARWDARMPVATVFNGPVTDVADAVGAAILKAGPRADTRPNQ
jgi:hypothetical protein